MLKSSLTYPGFNPTSASILLSAVLGRRRSFSQDARALVRRLDPGLTVHGIFPAAAQQGLVITVNHFSRPGFGAWWIALAVAATCPREMHWTVTSAWVYDDLLRSAIITPPSRWLLARLVRTYDFTSMPPMPPRPQDLEQRAYAVRKLLQYVDRSPAPILGLAPEGADTLDGQLMPPPAGVGRLLAQLLKRGLQILPVGVYESGTGLCLSIGSTLCPPIPDNREQQERQLTDLTMRAIAALLPPALRGSYA